MSIGPPLPSTATVRADALRVIGLVLLVLVGAEFAFRAVVPRLSVNSRTLALHAERAERIAAADTTTVLILGNSVSGDGIDAELLQAELSAGGASAHVEHQPADSSAMVDWYYQLTNQFVAAGATPDVVVLPVGNPFPLTRVNPQTEDLLFSFLQLGDLPEYIELAEVRGFDAQAGVWAGKLSSLYAFRGRLQKRVLSELSDGFPALRGAMLDAHAPGEPVVTDVWADAFAELADANDIDVVIVGMPTAPLGGRVPDSAREVAARHGWILIDTPTFEVSATEIPDGLHLEPEAAARFTRHLAPLLADRLPAERDR